MTKSRMWEYYNPFKKIFTGYWLPKDFSNPLIPKLAIEEDYMYETDDDWYYEHNIDLLIQRHSCNALRPGRVPTTWAPFSVDTDCFFNMNKDRNNMIVRCGSASPLYPSRLDATTRLKQHKLVHVKALHSKEDAIPFMAEHQYMECLNSYQAALVGVIAGGYPITPAKVFEIMACGTVMLHDHIPGMDYIIPHKCSVKFEAYSDDVVDKANWILNHPDKIKFMSDQLTACARKAHNHKIRTEQLLDLIADRIWERPLEWDTLVKDYEL